MAASKHTPLEGWCGYLQQTLTHSSRMENITNYSSGVSTGPIALWLTANRSREKSQLGATLYAKSTRHESRSGPKHVPRSREREKRPAARREKVAGVQKKCNLFMHVCERGIIYLVPRDTPGVYWYIPVTRFFASSDPRLLKRAQYLGITDVRARTA